jgi:DnaJ-class molecular chaperone
MKRIIDYRKLLGVEKTTTLAELKTTYRNLMKDWHPDKFQDEAQKKEAEETSKKIIAGYHFLVSISRETIAADADEYAVTVASAIADYEHKGVNLMVKFANGSSYEYFGVPRSVYIKLVNSDSQTRFARRHIYSSYVYRKVTKLATV